MCSIVGFKGSKKTITALLNDDRSISFIDELLKTKGGDEYKLCILANGFYNEIVFTEIQEVVVKLQSNLQIFNDRIKLGLLFFSRLTPEMESQTKNLQQPYFNNSIKTCIAIHGTIPRAEEFKKVEVDTEIFNTGKIIDNIEYVEKVGGKIALISMECNNDHIIFKGYENGLGLHMYKLAVDKDQSIDIYTNINYSSLLMEPKIFKYTQKYTDFKIGQPKTRIISLFSGGLDITCSTYNIIEKYKFEVESLDLWYFNWGTRAAEYEKQAGMKFRNLLIESTFKEDSIVRIDPQKINWDSFNITPMFTTILSTCDLTTTRLIDSDASGAGSHEAEAAISYVPYRNQFLLTLAAARAEQLYPNDHCVFVLGANLSEGMIYLDNSETFTNLMNQVIKVGGQSCERFEVQAPFVNRTKTDMVKQCLSKEYDLSTIYSCYFPKEDGSPCMECGSCLLQQNALARNKNLQKEKK